MPLRRRLEERFDAMATGVAPEHRRAGRAGDPAAARRAARAHASERPDEARGPDCGVDEAGRGPLAGPVFAAAVVLDPRRAHCGAGRFEAAHAHGASGARPAEDPGARGGWAVASASVEEIDALNILRASLLAMRRAVEGLSVTPQRVLVDGLHCPDIAMPARAIVGGDATRRRDLRRVDPGEGRARRGDAGRAPGAPRLRLRPPQGLRDAGASRGAAAARRVRGAPPELRAGARGARHAVRSV